MRIAINGYGRIGMCVLRRFYQAGLHLQGNDIVAINAPGGIGDAQRRTLTDSTHGRFPLHVRATETDLIVGLEHENRVRVLSTYNPSELPWGEMDVDVVIECTGKFRSKSACAPHLEQGARKVLISAPGKGEVDATVVFGVNEKILTPDMMVVSNASCTTNCVAPVAKILHENFNIVSGHLTTVHAVTTSQNLLDARHKDPRRARSALNNIIPTSTGAAKAVGQVLPELEGRLHGLSMRVPVLNGSCVVLMVNTREYITYRHIVEALAFAEDVDGLGNVLTLSHDPLVSSDIIGDPHSAIVDEQEIDVVGGHCARLLIWYDNEWGYASRLLDTALTMATL